jgi:hypothetical protein
LVRRKGAAALLAPLDGVEENITAETKPAPNFRRIRLELAGPFPTAIHALAIA